MVKDFNEFIVSLDAASKSKGKKGKASLHYIKQLRSLDKFYVLFASLLEELSNSCNCKSFDLNCVENVEYFRIPKSRAKGIRVSYDISFELQFGAPFSCYMFEKGYLSVISRGRADEFVFNKKLEDRINVYVSFFKSIFDETLRSLGSFSFEQKDISFFYDIDEEERNIATAKVEAQISIDLEKLSV